HTIRKPIFANTGRASIFPPRGVCRILSPLKGTLLSPFGTPPILNRCDIGLELLGAVPFMS
ncbi:MAG: hypothetical protein ACO3K9_14435, partial [Paracoccaceae bacterium]